jgi:predicted DNA-binding transcriptional regulator AlpA
MAIKRKRPDLIRMPDVIDMVSGALGIHALTVRRMAKQGQLPAPVINANRRLRWWRRADIEAFLEGNAA